MNPVKEQIFHLGTKALIHDGHSNLLLLKVTRKNGETYWDLPGGRINENETVEDSLKRELHEETGLTDFITEKHLGIFLTNIMIPLDNQQQVRLLMSVYLCSVSLGRTIITENNMIAEWVTLENALNNYINHFPADMLHRIQDEVH